MDQRDRDEELAAGRGPAPGAGAGTPWELENNPWTIEGEIEGSQRFATGVRRAKGWQRAVGLMLVAVFLIPFVYAVVHFVTTLLV